MAVSHVPVLKVGASPELAEVSMKDGTLNPEFRLPCQINIGPDH